MSVSGDTVDGQMVTVIMDACLTADERDDDDVDDGCIWML